MVERGGSGELTHSMPNQGSANGTDGQAPSAGSQHATLVALFLLLVYLGVTMAIHAMLDFLAIVPAGPATILTLALAHWSTVSTWVAAILALVLADGGTVSTWTLLLRGVPLGAAGCLLEEVVALAARVPLRGPPWGQGRTAMVRGRLGLEGGLLIGVVGRGLLTVLRLLAVGSLLAVLGIDVFGFYGQVESVLLTASAQ